MNDLFEIVGGSVLGRSHRQSSKNNQDALCCLQASGYTAAIVCDGCGSGAHSEVGAQLGARLVVRLLLRQAQTARLDSISLCDCQAMLEVVRIAAVRRLRVLARELGGSLPQIINEYLLFTIVGALLTPQYALFFSLGDGVMTINDEVLVLGPFPDNAPPYLAYGCVKSSLPDELLRFQVQRVLPLEQLSTFLIGSDGVDDLCRAALCKVPGKSESVGPLDRLWQDERMWRNPDMVRRRLAGLNRNVVWPDGRRENGLLPDDTTLIMGRRKRGEL